MDPIVVLSTFSFGIGMWLTTGIDDLLLLIGLLNNNHGKAKILSIACGQLIGVIGVLTVANFLINIFTLPERWQIFLSGVGLILAGVLILTSSSKGSIKKKRWLFLTAFTTYVSFASDDFLIAMGSLIPLATELRIVFSAGFVTGWMLSFVLALAGAQIKIKWFGKILPVVLIVIGLYRLLSVWVQ